MATGAIGGDCALLSVSAFLASAASAVHIGFDSILNLVVTLRFGTDAIDAIYVCYRQIAVSLNLARLTLRTSFAAAAAIHERFSAIFHTIGAGSGSAGRVGPGYSILLADA